jgi:hypothetical protein
MSTSKSARSVWAELNENGFNNIGDLQSALDEFHAGNTTAADADIDDFNRNCQLSGDELRLTRGSWRTGMVDAIEILEKRRLNNQYV